MSDRHLSTLAPDLVHQLASADTAIAALHEEVRGVATTLPMRATSMGVQVDRLALLLRSLTEAVRMAASPAAPPATSQAVGQGSPPTNEAGQPLDFGAMEQRVRLLSREGSNTSDMIAYSVEVIDASEDGRAVIMPDRDYRDLLWAAACSSAPGEHRAGEHRADERRELALRAFVRGAAWWEFEKEGATMWPSDQERAYHAGAAKYDRDPVHAFLSPADISERHAGHADQEAARAATSATTVTSQCVHNTAAMTSARPETAYDRLRAMTRGAKGDSPDYGNFLSCADATEILAEIDRARAASPAGLKERPDAASVFEQPSLAYEVMRAFATTCDARKSGRCKSCAFLLRALDEIAALRTAHVTTLRQSECKDDVRPTR